MLKIGNQSYKVGDIVTYTIVQTGETGLGRLYYDYEDMSDYERFRHGSYVYFYLCTSNPKLNGDRINDSVRMGYQYSHSFTVNRRGDYNYDSIKIRPFIGTNDDGSTTIKMKSHNITNDVMHFIRMNELENFLPIFEYELGHFDEYTRYEMSEKSGYLTLKTDKRTMEIKFGRFIRQMALKFNELVSKSIIKQLDVTEKLIETIHNKFVSYQQGDVCMVHIYQGEDINIGYTKNNYLGDSSGGSLHNSCMSDKFDYIEMYRENPNQVKLAVIYVGDKVAARGLVWTATDGKQYLDRVYYKFDWMESFMVDKLRSMGIPPLRDIGFRVVQLEKWNFKYYPYLDSFYYCDPETGQLLFTQGGKMISLRSTGGIGIPQE